MQYEVIGKVQSYTLGTDDNPTESEEFTVINVCFKHDDGEPINTSRLDIPGVPTDEQIVEHILKRGREVKAQYERRNFNFPHVGKIE